jgi:hypothetical protein
MSSISRRSLVTTAATLPALAVSALPAVASPADDRLVALASEVFKIYNVELDHAIDMLEAAEIGGDRHDLAAAEAVEIEVHDRLSNALDAVQEIRAQSVRGLAAKARVADLMCRDNGKVHSTGLGRRDAWMVVDDILAMTGTGIESTTSVRDAELLRLGVLLEPIEREYYAEVAAEKAARKVGGRDNCDWDDLNDRIFTLCNDILSRKATTIAGVTVQTRALGLTNGELWHAPWQAADESERLPSYFRSVCSVLGLALPPDTMSLDG